MPFVLLTGMDVLFCLLYSETDTDSISLVIEILHLVFGLRHSCEGTDSAGEIRGLTKAFPFQVALQPLQHRSLCTP